MIDFPLFIDLLNSWGACWGERRMHEYLGNRESVSFQEVLGDIDIPYWDRMWVLLQALSRGLLDESIFDFASKCAQGLGLEDRLEALHAAPAYDHYLRVFHAKVCAELVVLTNGWDPLSWFAWGSGSQHEANPAVL